MVQRHAAVASVVVPCGRASVVSVVAEFEEIATGWAITLSPGAGRQCGSHRKRLAVSRLCELDVGIPLAIDAGRSVNLSVQKNQREENTSLGATAHILPLLLSRAINDSLYSYQREGVAWLIKQRRAILGDDMGLGKTAQALAAARRLIRHGRISWMLVVCPRTLIATWIREAGRWAPELCVATALPGFDSRFVRWSRLVKRAHVLFTSYEQLRKPPAALVANPPDLIIADEAHRLRKADSQTTQGFRKIDSPRFWALTGTPIERDTEDLAVLLSLLDPGRFVPADGLLPPTTLRSLVRPYLLRRRKEHVLSELPQVIEETEVLELSEAQRKTYNSTRLTKLAAKQNQSILTIFNKLRMICDADPATGESSKLDRVCEIVSDIRAANEKVVVFSYVLDPLRRLQGRLAEPELAVRFATITGEQPLQERNKAIDTFRSDAGCVVLLASTRVASEGLTLTEANNVIFVNRWWNPSSNAQARDRVVRIGQSRIVRIVSFTCRDTVEERLEQLLEQKALTFDQVVEALSRDTTDRDAYSLIQ